jgi:hypothetical protein
MCFSAIASFVTGGCLLVIGSIICYLNNLIMIPYIVKYFLQSEKDNDITISSEVRKKFLYDCYHWWPMLLTTIFFALQQFCEGVVWLESKNKHQDHVSTHVKTVAGYIFSFFAFCYWPFWVPLICTVLELRIRKTLLYKKSTQIRLVLLAFMTMLGLALMIYSLVSMIISDLSISTEHRHIVYHFKLLDIGGYDTKFVFISLYLLCTIMPFSLVLSIGVGWIMSICIGATAISSYLIYSAGYFASTWCFFAAWISLVLGIIRVYDAKKMLSQCVFFHDIQPRDTIEI